jgi:hypothetical protein
MRTTTKLLLACALAALAACGRASKNGGLSVSTHAGIAAGAATATSGGLDLGNGIEITRVRMAVRKIKVEGGDAQANGCTAEADGVVRAGSTADHGGSGGGSGGGDDGGMDPGEAGSTEHENCELSVGPFDVDLAGSALTGQVQFAFDANIPDGTYEEIAIVINTVPMDKAGTNQVLLDLAALTPPASIVVDGFITDVGTTTPTPFTFATPIEVKQKREGAITIGGGSNLTLDFDPSGWFGTPPARLDPRVPSDQGAILDNIRSSIRLLDDEDHDGVDDHGEHGSGHH